MKRLAELWLALMLGAFPTLVFAQSTFENLGFESPTFVSAGSYPDGLVEWAPAMPGWTGDRGGSTATTLLHNNETLSGPSISIIDSSYSFRQPLIGTYSVLLVGGWNWQANVPADTSISQSGRVPSDAQSLRFAAWPGGPFSVSLGGNDLPLVNLGSHIGYNVYGADIHSYAGQSMELRFTSEGLQYDPRVLLDNIVFSTQPVPEPQSCFLFIAGLGCVWSICRKRRTQ